MFLRKSKLIMLLMVTSLLLILSACSGGGDPESTTDDGSAVEAEETKIETLSEVSDNSGLWLEVDIQRSEGISIAKDDEITGIYIFEDNEVSYIQKPVLDGSKDEHADGNKFTLSTVDEMSDEEVIDHVRNNNYTEDLDDRYKSTVFDNEHEPYHWSILTDETGNNTDYMRLIVQENQIAFEYDEYIYSEVYNSHYEGFLQDRPHDNYNSVMVKRVDEKDIGTIVYDEPSSDKDNVEIKEYD